MTPIVIFSATEWERRRHEDGAWVGQLVSVEGVTSHMWTGREWQLIKEDA